MPAYQFVDLCANLMKTTLNYWSCQRIHSLLRIEASISDLQTIARLGYIYHHTRRLITTLSPQAVYNSSDVDTGSETECSWCVDGVPVDGLQDAVFITVPACRLSKLGLSVSVHSVPLCRINRPRGSMRKVFMMAQLFRQDCLLTMMRFVDTKLEYCSPTYKDLIRKFFV